MIKIVFTASRGFVGRAIRWLTRGRVSHVMIEYTSGAWGGSWIAEATAVGVRKVPSYKARHDVVAEFEFDGEDGLKALSEYVGQNYDYAGIVVFGWALLWWRIFRRRLKKPTKNTKGQFCSELVSRLFIAKQLPETETWDPEKKTPEDLLAYCEAHPVQFSRTS